MIAGFMRWWASVIEAKSELETVREEARQKKEQLEIYSHKLRDLKHRQKLSEMKSKISDLEDDYEEDDDYDDEGEEFPSMPASPDALFGNLISQVGQKLLTNQQNTQPQPVASSPISQIPQEAVEVIKKCKTRKEFDKLAAKFYPSLDESTKDAVWGAFHSA